MLAIDSSKKFIEKLITIQGKDYIRGIRIHETDKLIVGYIADGLSHKEIADKLFRSYRTIEKRVQTLYNNLGLKNSAELAAFFIRRKIIK